MSQRSGPTANLYLYTSVTVYNEAENSKFIMDSEADPPGKNFTPPQPPATWDLAPPPPPASTAPIRLCCLMSSDVG